MKKVFDIRKIALIMAFVMLFNLPVFAASYARVNKTRVVRDGEMPSDLYLIITPLDEVVTGSSIIISYTNAKVPDQATINSIYNYNLSDWNGSKGFWDVMPNVKSNELPYSIRKSGLREIEVKLINLPRRFANTRNLYGVNGSSGVPVYKIRLPFITDGGGTMKISIDSNETTISSATIYGYTVYDGGRIVVETNGINTDTENAEEYERLYGSTTEATTEAATKMVESDAEATTEGVTEETTESETEEEPGIFDMEPDELAAVRDIVDTASLNDEDSYADWDADTKTATIYYNGITVEFTDGSDYYVVDGEIIYFEEDMPKAEIIDKKMHVPVGVAINALGLEPPKDEDEEETEEPIEETTDEADETTEELTEAASEYTE